MAKRYSRGRKRVDQNYRNRASSQREQRKRFLIFCEGTKTEPNYLKGFRNPGTVVIVKGIGKDPMALVKDIEGWLKQYKYEKSQDQVWCVFDRDDFPKQRFNSAIQKAKSKGWYVAYSNECFELWYILHFELLKTGIPRKDYAKKLSQYLGEKYEKNITWLYDELLSRQKIAIKNAETLLAEYEPLNPEQDNPSTTVHLLVQELNGNG